MNILLGVTGSVAATLTRKLQDSLIKDGHEVETIVTESAKNFRPTGQNAVDKFWYGFHDDKSEWNYYRDMNAVLHIDLVKWADVFLIAPCTANTLAKIANGVCDNLLTSCVRAWPIDKAATLEKPVYITPAMNCEMWKNPITTEHIRTLKNRGYLFIDPIEKELFCGDIGVGAMAHIDDIMMYMSNAKKYINKI